MSLVLALHTSPTRYALAADSRSFGDPAGLAHDSAQKAHQLGPWLVGYTGGIVAGQRLLRALERIGLQGSASTEHTREHAEAVLVAAFDAVQPTTGSAHPGNYPSTGTDVLLVGPPGIVAMGSDGTILWMKGNYWAIGCAEDYAMGWLDQCRPHWPTDLKYLDVRGVLIRCVSSAMMRYPGVGGEVVVLEVGG